ncbi:MAG: ABC transporter ATP-binding protein [Deltaproteobacteria bacterium]|nr:ABC transporter ATP-binding protein [Deltaproteobacteria bacterium]
MSTEARGGGARDACESGAAPRPPAPREAALEALRTEGLCKSFAGRRHRLRPWKRSAPIVAVDGVDLAVAAGELVAVVGPNGAGKTTLLKILAALIAPSSGRIDVLGVDAIADPAGARARVGYILPDERSFYWRISARDNLRFFAALVGLEGRTAQGRIEDLARLFGLGGELDRTFADLSSGQRQRLAIMRGLLADPPVLLFDEATRSLDPGRAAQLRQIVRVILVERQRKAVLFATHDLAEARELADRTVLMVRGRIAVQGAFEAIASDLERAFAEESAAERAELLRIVGSAA